MTKKTTAPSNVKDLISLRDVILEAIEVQASKDDAKDGTLAVSQHLLVCAKRFCDGKTKQLDVELFLTACLAEEKFIKSDEAGKNKQDKVPHCWSTAKSNIKQGAINFDMSPANYSTESKFRKDLNEARKAAKAADIEATHDEVKDGKLAARKVSSDISGVMGAIADTYNRLDDAGKDKLKTDLLSMHKRYKEAFKAIVMADVKKAKDPVTEGPRGNDDDDTIEVVAQ